MQPPFDREHLCQLVASGAQPKYLFFWGHTTSSGSLGKECLSQWFSAAFEVAGVEYRTAEHFMMAEKARLFGDAEALDQILAATTPAEAKQGGRAVRGFNEELWLAERWRIVVAGSCAKFQQNPTLREYLLGTHEQVLVEASPRDRIWGIGMGANNPAAGKPDQWRGLNLLGFALMEARRSLSEQA